MKTFAFSTTDNYFTTRYSFEPDCYASIDNIFVSLNKREQTPESILQSGARSNVCWVHNVNPQMNTFYDVSTASQIVVVSNENPSKEKAFNSISLEVNNSDPNAFFANVITNAEDLEEIQSSHVKNFTRREGNLYASIGSSKRNSTRNIRYTGNRISTYFQPELIGTLITGFTVQMIFPTGMVQTGPQNRLYVSTGDQNQLAFLPNVNVAQIQYANKNTAYDASKLYIESISGSGPIYSVKIKIDGTPANQTMLEELDAFFDINRPIFIISNAETHGDSLRGKYAAIFLSSKEESKTKPFELYCINVDYAQSKLDSSLG
jgi:hypothetical protein